jgi:hypothetical protein
MNDGTGKKFILSKCLFKNCWSIGVGGGVGDIFKCDFIPSGCEFVNCSEGDHENSSTVGGGFYYLFLLYFFFLFVLFNRSIFP